MAEFAYTTVPGKIKPLMAKIQEVGVPSRATQSWLTSIGYASTNDRTLLAIMRLIGFIDDTGRPTSSWEEFWGGDRGALARAIEQGYSALYEVYPDAHKRSSAELESIIKSAAPKLGKDAVSRALSTFRALVDLADFGATGSSLPGGNGMNPNGHHAEPVVETSPATVVRSLWAGVTINVNVQLTLPETTDGTVYEKLFAAMREHLLEGMTSSA